MTAAVCSWCSTEIPEGATTCPNCGANLIPDADTDVPGVTAVDAASIIRSRSGPPRSRLLSWISGESVPEQPSKAEQQAIAPPDDEVRREILRLELEAEVAKLQAESDALRAEAVAEGRPIPTEIFDAAGGPSAEGTSTVDEAAATTEPAEPPAEEPPAEESPAEESPTS